MDIKIGSEDGAPIWVVYELFKDLAPKTCENFIQLCNGEYTNKQGEKIGYKYSYFHWVYPKAFVQGGDVRNKKGAKSIFDGEFFDESFEVKHCVDGLLGMCKKDEKRHSNECQFYVTLNSPLSYMDGKSCVFGWVIQGMRAFWMMERISGDS